MSQTLPNTDYTGMWNSTDFFWQPEEATGVNLTCYSCNIFTQSQLNPAAHCVPWVHLTKCIMYHDDNTAESVLPVWRLCVPLKLSTSEQMTYNIFLFTYLLRRNLTMESLCANFISQCMKFSGIRSSFCNKIFRKFHTLYMRMLCFSNWPLKIKLTKVTSTQLNDHSGNDHSTIP